MAKKITLHDLIEIAEEAVDVHFPKGDKARGRVIAVIAHIVTGLSKKGIIKKS